MNAQGGRWWHRIGGARRVKQVAGSAILIILFIWFARFAAENYSSWLEYLADINLVLLCFSLLISLASFLFETWIWRNLVAEFGFRLTFADAFQVFYVSNLARYIPGRIWQTSATMILLRGYGVPLKSSAMISIVSQIATLVAGLIISLPIIYFWQSASGVSWNIWLSLAGVGGLLACAVLFPDVWMNWLNGLLARVGREPMAFPLSRAGFAKYIALYGAMWACAGVAFYVLLLAVNPLEITNLPFIIAASTFGYVIGYLLLFVPGGLGVRELALLTVLSFVLPVSVATFVAILSRFWLVAIELILGVVALALYTYGHKPSQPLA